MSDTSSTHRQAWDLIPWIVNGSAPESEQRTVQAHLESCADCRAELEFQRQLQAAMAQDSTPDSDVRGAWERLRSRLDGAVEPEAQVGAVQRRARGSGVAWMPWLVAAMVVQAIGLGALGAAWWSRPSAPASLTAPAAVYRTLSATEAAAPPATIRVVFAPDVTIAQLQAMLAAARLQVRSGPSDVGVWTLGPARNSDRAATEAALHELRGNSEVRFAEALAGPP
ncbi:MAG: zf-HC2 domain-containing protein [Steroidobacterales bacterium]